MTQQYGPGDLAAIWELAETFERMAPNEQRLRMEGLGLTPKGRQDRRWRLMHEVAPDVTKSDPKVDEPQLAEVRRLHVVAPEAS